MERSGKNERKSVGERHQKVQQGGKIGRGMEEKGREKEREKKKRLVINVSNLVLSYISVAS